MRCFVPRDKGAVLCSWRAGPGASAKRAHAKPLALLHENDSMPPNTHPPHYCVLTQREERDAVLHQRYLGYVSHFERWGKPKAWVRYFARHPVAAVVSMVSGQQLPTEWTRQPLSEVDFLSEIFLAHIRRMSRTD